MVRDDKNNSRGPYVYILPWDPKCVEPPLNSQWRKLKKTVNVCNYCICFSQEQKESGHTGETKQQMLLCCRCAKPNGRLILDRWQGPDHITRLPKWPLGINPLKPQISVSIIHSSSTCHCFPLGSHQQMGIRFNFPPFPPPNCFQRNQFRVSLKSLTATRSAKGGHTNY